MMLRIKSVPCIGHAVVHKVSENGNALNRVSDRSGPLLIKLVSCSPQLRMF